MNPVKEKVFIIGGGPAGFFAAITMAESNPEPDITILEKSDQVLQKVKISGGGRCNLTHACFIPQELIRFYPRGNKELLGPFHTFMTGDTMEWFENRGVPLKTEEDNRVFPVSDSSQDIIDCLIQNAEKNKVKIIYGQNVVHIEKKEKNFLIKTDLNVYTADKILIATGSNPKIWKIIERLGHTIIPPVPSLFTFKIDDERIKEIPGVSVPNVKLSLNNTRFESQGPLLITHWGLSGPAVLKLSSFGALFLAEKKYHFQLKINWLSRSSSEVLEELRSVKRSLSGKQVNLRSPFEEIPKRLWIKLVTAAHISKESRWADLSKKQMGNLCDQLVNSVFTASGKATFKDEFVTAGGVDLKEINFKRFESRIHKNLFFAGEVLNIDAVTGGFNFQNAWTGGFIAGKSIAAHI